MLYSGTEADKGKRLWYGCKVNMTSNNSHSRIEGDNNETGCEVLDNESFD